MKSTARARAGRRFHRAPVPDRAVRGSPPACRLGARNAGVRPPSGEVNDPFRPKPLPAHWAPRRCTRRGRRCRSRRAPPGRCGRARRNRSAARSCSCRNCARTCSRRRTPAKVTMPGTPATGLMPCRRSRSGGCRTPTAECPCPSAGRGSGSAWKRPSSRPARRRRSSRCGELSDRWTSAARC